MNYFTQPRKSLLLIALALILFVSFACGGTPTPYPTPTIKEKAWDSCTAFVAANYGILAVDAQKYKSNLVAVGLEDQSQFQVTIWYEKASSHFICIVHHNEDGLWDLLDLKKTN